MKLFQRKPTYDTKIIDQTKSLDSSDSSEATKQSKALEAEAALHEAIQFTEKRTGSLVVFQKATKDNIDDLGRQLSTLSADFAANDDQSIQSLNSMRSEPLFIKVESCEPSVLRQLSWETMSDVSSTRDNTEETTEPGTKRKNKRKNRRKWDKLRTNIKEQGKDDASLQKKLKFFRRKPKGNGRKKTTSTQYAITKKQKSRHVKEIDMDRLLEGDSFEVIAYNNSETGFAVLPPFPSKFL